MAGMGTAKALTIILVGVLASGCIVAESANTPQGAGGAQTAPDAAEPASFDETTGAISGVIVTDEGLPLAGALVGIRETAAQTVSDVGGAFTFSNLVPGEYTIDVSQLGYESVSKRVSVSVGEISHVNVALATIAVETAYYETIPEIGHILCSVRAYPGVPTTTESGLPPWVTGVAICGDREVPGLPPDRFMITWELPTGVLEILTEMVWSSTQATGSALGVAVEHQGFTNNPEGTVGTGDGKSPVIVYANQTRMQQLLETSGEDCLVDECQLQTRVFAEAETTGLGTPVPLGPFPDPLGDPKDRMDFGFTFDQKYTIYMTHFHGEPMVAGFSALADG